MCNKDCNNTILKETFSHESHFYITFVARVCAHGGVHMVREYSVATTIDQLGVPLSDSTIKGRDMAGTRYTQSFERIEAEMLTSIQIQECNLATRSQSQSTKDM
jgi:hypothetical protein